MAFSSFLLNLKSMNVMYNVNYLCVIGFENP